MNTSERGMTQRPVVEQDTRLGRVRGYERLGVYTFLGLRYASPPRRFMPAEPAQAWSGTYDATTYKPIAPQMPIDTKLFGPLPQAGYDEDCLTLNIHAPTQPSATPRPVLVFVHGGGHVSGAANFYDGTALAFGANAVVVCINYRLGILAAVDARRFHAEGDGGGELWLSDQILALHWVRDNIADYGGNPDLVTIIGESGGAVSVIALCAAPATKGLIHRAVACSPGSLVPDPANDVVGAVARSRRCTREQAIGFLQGASTAELMALQKRQGDKVRPWEVCRTPLLPGEIKSLIAARGAHAVPLIAGYATHEGLSLEWMARLALPLPRLVVSLLTHLAARGIARLPAGGKAGIPAYLKRLKKVTGSRGFGERFNDLVWTDVFRRAAMEYTEATSAAGSRGYLYVIDVPTRIAGQVMPSSHCVDLALTFNIWDDPEHTVPSYAEHPNAPELARRWVRMLAHFARTGEPGPALGDWPAYEPGNRASLRVAGEGCRLEHDVDPQYREQVWR